ncbi:MAG: hypothetical protein ACOCZ5_01545 [bacterium]
MTKNGGFYSEQEKTDRLETIREYIADTYRREYSSKGLPKYLSMTVNPTFEAIFNCDNYLLVHPNY